MHENDSGAPADVTGRACEVTRDLRGSGRVSNRLGLDAARQAELFAELEAAGYRLARAAAE